jgi:hypothetical protein
MARVSLPLIHFGAAITAQFIVGIDAGLSMTKGPMPAGAGRQGVMLHDAK